MPNNHKGIWFIFLLPFAVAAILCVQAVSTSGDTVPAPVFVSDNPQSIYAADPNDSWNRIFRALFTRTVTHRVSDAFPEGAHFVPFRGPGLDPLSLRISKKKFSRTELGDRAIDPLYPTFFTIDGVLQVLSEPRFSDLTTALREGIDERRTRSPVERALMQADAWAAYDILYLRPVNGTPVSERRAKLLTLLRQFIRKLALTNDEIESLQNNYLLAVNENKLPNMFSEETGWLEIEFIAHRLHDETASYRRAARVFVKPRTPPSDPGRFVESLKNNQHHNQVEAVALVIQNLLMDKTGRVVPSPLFSDVQFRFFKNDPKTSATTAEPQQFELSRRKLLTEPASGGLVEISPTSPAYLSTAGNDYDFATPVEEAGASILVPLRARCTQCHGSSLTHLMTYSFHEFPSMPAVRILKGQERALYVTRRKAEREDFKSLSGIHTQ